MTTFSEIKESISQELSDLNRTILEALSSNCSLLNTVVDTYLETKGKQIRPIITILSAKFFFGVNEAVIYGAAAVELLHNASLIHDDVIDESKTRRGKATVNSIWDNHVAVLAGDFFVSKALKCAIKTGDFRVISSIGTLGETLSTGELDQIDIAKHHTINEENYYSIISRKTASLFRSCVEVGGYAAKASDSDIENLGRYAEMLGLCFQIRDDIFDYFDSKEVGKPTGNDLREGKATLPLVYALSKDTPQSKEMRKIYEKESLSEEEIATLIEFAKSSGGIDYAYSEMERIGSEAAQILAQYPDSEAKTAFLSLFQFITKRQK